MIETNRDGMLQSQAVEREYEESHWEVASPAPGPASGQMMENVEHLHHKPVEDWPANMDRSEGEYSDGDNVRYCQGGEVGLLQAGVWTQEHLLC